MEMPQKYREFGQMWQQMNPGWVVKDWTFEDVAVCEWHNQKAMQHILMFGGNTEIPHTPEAAKWTQFADILGYEIIYNFGGVYLNCDIEPLRPLSELPVDENDAWACVEVEKMQYADYNGRDAINNGALGAPRMHPFFKKCVEVLDTRFFGTHYGRPMHLSTGPALISEVHWLNPGLLRPLRRETFNFVSHNQVEVGGDASFARQGAYDAGAVGLHHWNHKAKNMRTDG